MEVIQLFVRDYVGYLYWEQFFGFRFKIADYSKTLLKVLVEVIQLFVRDYVGYLYSVPVQFFGFRFKIADYSKTLLKVQLRLLNRGLIIAAQEAAAVAGTSGGESGSGKKATVRMR